MNRSIPPPPRIAAAILRQVALASDRLSILGDFEEIHRDLWLREGRRKARAWYWGQVFISLPMFLKTQFDWSAAMLKNYLKVTLRNLLKHKGYSALNIAGLAMGMACSILILFWVKDELSYDKFHPNAKNLYVVASMQNRAGQGFRTPASPAPLAAAISKEIPEIESTARYFTRNDMLIKRGNDVFNERDIAFTDPSLFSVFSFPFVEGDPTSALRAPDEIILTERLARKIFGKESALGQALLFNGNLNLRVTGIVKDPPRTSTLTFNALLPLETLKNISRQFEGIDDPQRNWGIFLFNTYLRLRPGTSIAKINEGLNGILSRSPLPKEGLPNLYLFPFLDLHLRALQGGGPITYVYIFSLIGVFVLLLACFNFINLSTARAGRRAREVAMRKVVGANRRNVLAQFFGESLATTLFAFLLSLALAAAALPLFNSLSGKHLRPGDIDAGLVLALFGLVVVTGVIAGSYPAVVLSSFRPASVFRQALKGGSSTFRKILVILQFAVSIGLIVCTLNVSRQMNFIQAYDLGFNHDQTLMIPLRPSLQAKLEPLKDALLGHSGVRGVTASSARLAGGPMTMSYFDWEGRDPNQRIPMSFMAVDFGFMETFDIKMAAGRTFSKSLSTDAGNFVINEDAVRKMGLTTPLGKRMSFGNTQGTIIGVVKDFHFRPLYNAVEPLVLIMNPGMLSQLVVKIGPGDIRRTVDFIRTKILSFVPDYPYEAYFLDEEFGRVYAAEMRLGKLFLAFAVLTILISSLGLFGLAAFMAEQRTREIGIRRVLGASISSITRMLSREFAVWVLLANVIAWPASFFAVGLWLRSFTVRAAFSPWTYILAAGLGLTIALMTVGFQAVRAASADPVQALKYE
jgi:putative ABC transport system permease protein